MGKRKKGASGQDVDGERTQVESADGVAKTWSRRFEKGIRRQLSTHEIIK
jgi:hypothetical protein